MVWSQVGSLGAHMPRYTCTSMACMNMVCNGLYYIYIYIYIDPYFVVNTVGFAYVYLYICVCVFGIDLVIYNDKTIYIYIYIYICTWLYWCIYIYMYTRVFKFALDLFDWALLMYGIPFSNFLTHWWPLFGLQSRMHDKVQWLVSGYQ